MSTRILLSAIFLSIAGTTLSADLPGADDIVRQSLHAFYYAGDDMSAEVSMELVDARGQKQTRVLAMFRRDETADAGGDRDVSRPRPQADRDVGRSGGGTQKYFLYFREPGDVRRTAFLVWKYPSKEDDRWIFLPALNMTRRVAARDSRSRFVGSDFTYEDISGRDIEADASEFLREEKCGDAECYVVESLPIAAAEYAKKISWIDKKTYLPVKEEYFDAKNVLVRLFTADRVEEIPGRSGGNAVLYPTVTKRTMKDVPGGRQTTVTFTRVVYNSGLADADFKERSLQRPPAKWIR